MPESKTENVRCTFSIMVTIDLFLISLALILALLIPSPRISAAFLRCGRSDFFSVKEETELLVAADSWFLFTLFANLRFFGLESEAASGNLLRSLSEDAFATCWTLVTLGSTFSIVWERERGEELLRKMCRCCLCSLVKKRGNEEGEKDRWKV